MLIAKGATGILGNAKNIATTLQPIGNAIKSIGLAAQTAPSVGAFISDLGAMVPTAAKFGLAAAAVTAAVVGIGVAVDNYNQKAFSQFSVQHDCCLILPESNKPSYWFINISLEIGVKCIQYSL